jgi:hypothetical protein
MNLALVFLTVFVSCSAFASAIQKPPTLGAPVAGATSGSMLFGGTGGILQQDNANLFWDDTNNRIGIGTTTPGQKLSITGSFGIRETAGSPLGYTIFETGNQGQVDLTYRLPISQGSTGQTLQHQSTGILKWDFITLQDSWNQGQQIDVNAGNPLTLLSSGARTTPLLSLNLTNLESNAEGIQLVDTGTSSNNFYGIFAELNSSVTNTNAGIYMAWAGAAGNDGAGAINYGGSAIVVEIVDGASDAAQLILDDTAAVGHNLVLSRGGAGYLGIDVPPQNVGDSYSITMPATQGSSGETLINDGTGVLSWAVVPKQATLRTDTDAASATCAITCNAGEILTGGGCSNTLALSLSNSYPSSGNTWSCTYTLATGDCTASAMCWVYNP